MVDANFKLEEKTSKATEKENSINSETVIFEMACTKLGGEEALARAIKRGDVKVTDQGARVEVICWRSPPPPQRKPSDPCPCSAWNAYVNMVGEIGEPLVCACRQSI